MLLIKTDSQLCKEIRECVEHVYEVERGCVCSKSRLRTIVRTRRMVMFIYRFYLFMGISQIGRELNRHHASVLHGLKQFEIDMMLEPDTEINLRTILEENDLMNHKTSLINQTYDQWIKEQ